MILVTGATGNVGGELVRQLAAARQPVRALVRKAEPSSVPAGVDVATGDLDHPPGFVDAFFRFFVDGEFDDATVLPTVDQLIGRPPHGFERWARDHAAAFR